MKTVETLSINMAKAMKSLFNQDNPRVEKYILPYLERFKSEVLEEPNDFIRDIAKLFGEDNLGLDGITWTIDDFKEALMRFRNDWIKQTRHACSESVGMLQDDVIFDGSGGIDRDKAHAACMNVDVISSEDSKKTMPCPSCGTPLILPKEYFGAMEKLREAVLKYREVLIKDIKLDHKENESS